MDDLKQLLDIGKDEYKNFADLKKRILIPAQKELVASGDCWFNASEAGFENRDGKRVSGLNFKVITKDTDDVDRLKYNNLRNILKTNFGFKDNDLETVRPVIQQTGKFGDIALKIMALKDKNKDENGNVIMDKISYISSSFINEFCPDKQKTS